MVSKEVLRLSSENIRVCGGSDVVGRSGGKYRVIHSAVGTLREREVAKEIVRVLDGVCLPNQKVVCYVSH